MLLKEAAQLAAGTKEKARARRANGTVATAGELEPNRKVGFRSEQLDVVFEASDRLAERRCAQRR